MKPNLSQLLTDLYSADPSLKDHEKVLKPILKKLIAARPNAPIDAQFKAKLREEVWDKIGEVRERGPAHFSLPKWGYAFGGATLAAVILVPTLFMTLSPGTIDFSLQVKDETSESADHGKGGGGHRTLSTSDLEEDEDYAAIYDYYPYTTFTYVYKGDEIKLDGTPTEVFSKEIFNNEAIQVNSWLPDLDLDLIDLEAFEEFKMSYLTIEAEDDAGYSVNFDYANNMISLSYWDASKWEEEWDYSSSNKKMSTAEALQIATDFINKHNIQLQGYGDPIIDEQEIYDGYAESYLTVIYPIELNDLILYESWGSPEGITLTISIEDEQVDSLWGLSPQNYSSTLYDTITDSSRILEIAERGGYNGYIDLYADEIVELDLGTPFKALTKIYDYDGDEYLERLVPALIFPITEYHEENYTDYIVVPLVEEFLGDEYPNTPELLEGEEPAG